ncbi:MAG TPA: NUDIX domain-containing protein [Caulobacteraceae bacterium]|nr:NUDIX domain-containing protein [Caulobacteraceae bacterium]
MPTSDAEPVGARRTPIARAAVRALIVSPDAEVLLLRIRSPEGVVLWIAPGGGIEAGEEIAAALRRELDEEVGLGACEIGPLVWRRCSTFDWGAWRVTQSEDYHVVHAARFEPVMRDLAEAEITEAFRWWPIEALAGTDEMVVPRTLAQILAGYLRDGAPSAPPEVEVDVD